MSAGDDRWVDGTARMDAVYGLGFSDRLPTAGKSPWLVDTVEHLFTDI
ncbi:hypothetical protein [Rathayibacter sp. SD072]|nr:hypothetical protein [Rathayibacter sp. SD072]